jgi:predicted DNA-binding transcriptional regulator YafY
MDDSAVAEPYALVGRLIRLRNLLRYDYYTPERIVAHLADDYTVAPASQRQLRRDLQSLRALGYHVERRLRPLRWQIRAGPTFLNDEEVATLRAIQAAFTEYHPLTVSVQRLIARLTQQLSPAQQQIWQREVGAHLTLAPVIDYSPHADLIRWLAETIQQGRQVAFAYRSQGSSIPTEHPRVDLYGLEFSDGHVYVQGFSYRFGNVLTFRVDRIVQDPARPSPERLPNMQQPRRGRPLIHFTYRLAATLAADGVSERFTIHAVRPDGDWVLVEASDTSEFRIVRVLLSYGERAQLIAGPPSLLERMRTSVTALAQLYA